MYDKKNKIYKISDYESFINFLQKLYGSCFHEEEEAFFRSEKIMIEDISKMSSYGSYTIKFKNEENKRYKDIYTEGIFKFFIEVNKFTQEELDV
ncbi:MAG: hypothetical protein BWY04_01304 [candidate division CPR1 bacterium ADurb.Bin160]|uniref:Uncharacterized protein n=1 Tax=candidate division CPR1 bacterium ADurb.Bin160 TaxID=1852826 RepID=A0A1V5ZK39_9BACT|nr:MAG: hypothetical protein BWY04_01304 [candidate division CPR1 bacterium ADurb.Bin160]